MEVTTFAGLIKAPPAYLSFPESDVPNLVTVFAVTSIMAACVASHGVATTKFAPAKLPLQKPPDWVAPNLVTVFALVSMIANCAD